MKSLVERGMALTFTDTVTKHYKLREFYSIAYLRPLLFKMNKLTKILGTEKKVLKVKFFNQNSLESMQFDKTSCSGMSLSTIKNVCVQGLSTEYPIPLTSSKYSSQH